MKNIFIIGLLTLSTLNCKAQIVPVEQVLNTFDNVPDENAYIKDVNNIFNDYIGTWTGATNNKNYEFYITKTTVVFDEDYNINQDILLMRYLITDSLGTVIENTTATSDDNAPCTGVYFRTTSQPDLTYVFSYGGEEFFCGQNGDVFITLINNNTQMYLLLYPNHEIYSDCQTGLAEQVLPTEKILLTKQ